VDGFIVGNHGIRTFGFINNCHNGCWNIAQFCRGGNQSINGEGGHLAFAALQTLNSLGVISTIIT
jgi:hypothetical protein